MCSSLGCGSDSDGFVNTNPDNTPIHYDPPDNAPTNVTLSVDGPKRLRMEWDFVNKTDHYVISEDKNGLSSYVEVAGATSITALSHSFEIPVHRQPWGISEFVVDSCNRDDSSMLRSNPTTLPSSLNTAAIGCFHASNPGGDHFGWAVAISDDGKTIAIGAPHESSKASGINGDQTDNSIREAGAVYVFRQGLSGWEQEAYIKSSATDMFSGGYGSYDGDLFGYSVALSSDGNTLAVGSPREDLYAPFENSFDRPVGVVYLFARTGSTWTEEGYTWPGYPHLFMRFGHSVALSSDGRTLAVGAPDERSLATGINGDESNFGPAPSGAAYIFRKTASGWIQHHDTYIKASNTGADDSFGCAVTLSSDGNFLAVGAYGEASTATGINGDQTDNSIGGAGAVYLYRYSSNEWAQEAYVKASNAPSAFHGGFGQSVSLSASGDTLAVGSMYDVYVFERTASIWSQQANLTNTPSTSEFGRSVSLSANGDCLAVGNPYDDSSATGINGNQADTGATSSGAAHFFSRSGATWAQESYIKASNTAVSDCFGWSVAINNDGNTLVVGTYRRNIGGAFYLY